MVDTIELSFKKENIDVEILIALLDNFDFNGYIEEKDYVKISRLISAAENNPNKVEKLINDLHKIAETKKSPVLGITGTGGAGKSSLVDEIAPLFK